MRYLLLIVSFAVALGINLLSKSVFFKNSVLAITTLQNITNNGKIAQTYIPPDRGAPSSTSTGGSRGSQCILSKEKTLPLLVPGNNIGLTLSEYPTFFVDIPPYQEAETAGFFLAEWYSQTNKQYIYERQFKLPEKSGIIKIQLPQEKAPPLEVGKKYTWEVQIYCNMDGRGDQSGDAWSAGFIERIPPSIYLVDKLKNANPLELPAVYAAQGIWYEALESLVELRSLNPNNKQLVTDWEELFNSANSEERESFIDAPLLECCQVEE